MHRIPDPTGSIHDALQIENAARNLPVSEPLRLWRALTTNRSNRVFTSRPLGENSMREQIGKCNLRIPLDLQVENPTGHSGRKTFCSVSVNNNVSALVVAQATKHKDPKTLMGYVSVSDNSLMEASLAISSAANRVHQNSTSVAGIDLFADNCDYCSDNDIPPVKRLCVSSDLSDKSNCVTASSAFLRSVILETVQLCLIVV